MGCQSVKAASGVFVVPISCVSVHWSSSLVLWLAWRSARGGPGMKGVLGSDLHLPIREKQNPACSVQSDWQLDGWLVLSSSEHAELEWDPPGEEPHVLLLDVATVSLDVVWSKSYLTILPIYMKHSYLIHQASYWFNLLLPCFRSY